MVTTIEEFNSLSEDEKKKLTDAELDEVETNLKQRRLQYQWLEAVAAMIADRKLYSGYRIAAAEMLVCAEFPKTPAVSKLQKTRLKEYDERAKNSQDLTWMSNEQLERLAFANIADHPMYKTIMNKASREKYCAENPVPEYQHFPPDSKWELTRNFEFSTPNKLYALAELMYRTRDGIQRPEPEQRHIWQDPRIEYDGVEFNEYYGKRLKREKSQKGAENAVAQPKT